MFIQSPNFNRNYLLIKKDALQLSDLKSKQYNLLPITPNPKMALSTNFFSKNNQITEAEKDTFRYLAERNAVNDGFERSEVVFAETPAEVEALL